MKGASLLSVACLLCKSFCSERLRSNGESVPQEWRIYRVPGGGEVPMLSQPHGAVSASTKSGILRFGWLPCSCHDAICSCCTDMNINLFNFHRHACMNVTYDECDFSLGFNMLMNEESIYENSISAKNPPPACLALPIPLLPTVDFCARLHHIRTEGRNLVMCLQLETRLERAPLLILEFDCLRIGAAGLGVLKPDVGCPLESEGGDGGEEVVEGEAEQLGADIFDEVDPDRKKASSTKPGAT